MDEDSNYWEPSPPVAQALRWISIALFGAYLLAIASQSLPVRLINAGWRIGAINILVDNASLPLVGLGFAHLAAYLAPRDSAILAFRQRVSSWAVLACLGFVLIIPLQISSAVSLYFESSNARLKEFDKADLRLVDLGAAIQNSGTTEQLQAALIGFQGMRLSNADRSQPLNSLKRLLVGRVNEARQVLKERRRLVSAKLLDPSLLMIRSFRVVVTSFFFALAFAACAQRPNRPVSLLEEVRAGWFRKLDALAEWREQRLAQRAEWEQQREEQQRLAAFEALRRQQQELEDQEGLNRGSPVAPRPPASVEDYYAQIMPGQQPPDSTVETPSEGAPDSSPPLPDRGTRPRLQGPGSGRSVDGI